MAAMESSLDSVDLPLEPGGSWIHRSYSVGSASADPGGRGDYVENTPRRNTLTSEITLTQTCAMAVDRGSSKYPHLSRLMFLEVLARDHYDRPLVVLYGCRLPNLSKTIQREIVDYVKETLDGLVQKEYDAIFFNYGTRTLSMRTFSILKKCYDEFDRNYKKNIKKLYIVHPSKAMMTIYALFKRYISKKFEQKLRPVKNLQELQSVVNLELMHIPKSIKSYDLDRNLWSEFGKDLQQVSMNSQSVPYLVEQCITFLRTNGYTEKQGIFRVSGSANNQKSFAAKYSVCPESFEFPPETNPYDVTGLMKQFFHQLPSPILTYGILNLPDYSVETVCDYVRNNLDYENKTTLCALFSLMEEIVSHSAKNQMTAENLMISIAPSLAWSDTPDIRDVEKLRPVFAALLQNYTSVFSMPPRY